MFNGINIMEPIRSCLTAIELDLNTGSATESTHRPALKTLLLTVAGHWSDDLRALETGDAHG
jgi:hypothetical protein